MISVDLLWRMIQDLARIDHAGYSSTDEFNRNLVLAQEDMMDYYVMMYESTTRIGEGVRPLVAENRIPKSGDSFPLPSDYRQRIAFGSEIWSACPDGGESSFSVYPIDYKSQNEIWGVLSNEVDKPRLLDPSTYAVEVFGDTIKVYPSSFKGAIRLKYFINPPVAERAYTLNTTTQEEELDSGATIDLVWPASEISNFIELMLLYKGISIRDGEVAQWVAQKRNIVPKTVINN